MPRVLVPTCPGALSALGILLADGVRDYSKTVMVKSGADLERYFKELEESAGISSTLVGARGSVTRSLDLRYAGQGYELNIPFTPEFVQSFHRMHQKRYGHADERKPVEIVNIRLRVTIPAEVIDLPTFPSGDGDAAQALLETRPMIFAGKSRAGKVYQRERLDPDDRLDGPAIVVEYSATTVIPPGWVALVDAYKNLVMEAKQ
jgi:N-methylhydantoinase A